MNRTNLESRWRLDFKKKLKYWDKVQITVSHVAIPDLSQKPDLCDMCETGITSSPHISMHFMAVCLSLILLPISVLCMCKYRSRNKKVWNHRLIKKKKKNSWLTSKQQAPSQMSGHSPELLLSSMKLFGPWRAPPGQNCGSLTCWDFKRVML